MRSDDLWKSSKPMARSAHASHLRSQSLTAADVHTCATELAAFKQLCDQHRNSAHGKMCSLAQNRLPDSNKEVKTGQNGYEESRHLCVNSGRKSWLMGAIGRLLWWHTPLYVIDL